MVLAPLGIELAVWIVAVGVLIFCLLSVYIAKAFFGLAGGVLGKLPVVGGWIDSGLHSVEHKIVSVMSSAAVGAQNLAGGALHMIAREIDWIGREINRHANLLAIVAGLLTGSATLAELGWLHKALRTLIHGTAGTLTAALHRLEALEKRLAHETVADVLPRIRGLEREIDHVVEHDIASLRARERALEDGALNVWKWIRTHPLSLATTAFVGAVAIALQRLGGSWIRCNNWNRIGRSVCGLPLSLIEDLFAATVVGFAVTDICEFASIAQGVAQVFEPELMALVDLEDALVGCHGATGLPALTLPRLSVPSGSLSLPLAA